jgi:hypothetical protein
MAQEIKQGSIFGRIGTGLGQGLAEQIPKEIERNRMRSHLNALSEQKDLTPFQRYAGLLSTPGITPQGIQTGGQLLEREARNTAANKFLNPNQQQQQQPFPSFPSPQTGNNQGGSPSVVNPESYAQAQKGFIPPTTDQKRQETINAFNSNPAYYGNDINNAINEIDNKYANEEKINLAHEARVEKQTGIEKSLVKRLEDEAKSRGLLGEGAQASGTAIPADIYKKIEQKALDSIRPKEDGTPGKTEIQAAQEASKEMEDVSREYGNVNAIGGWSFTDKSPEAVLSNWESIQKGFKKRGDVRNLAQTMIHKNNYSPMLSYSLADPIKDYPELNSFMGKLPRADNQILAKPARSFVRSLGFQLEGTPEEKTSEIAPKLAEVIKKGGSPLAMAYELDKLGYDADVMMKYLVDNQIDLDLSAQQIEQLGVERNFNPVTNPRVFLNDLFFKTWSGLDKEKK